MFPPPPPTSPRCTSGVADKCGAIFKRKTIPQNNSCVLNILMCNLNVKLNYLLAIV